MDPELLQPEEQVLSTLDAEGKRRWLFPRLSPGRFLLARRLFAYFLIAVFTLLPYITINGHPAILLDIVHRKFHIFGFTFLPTDTVLLALLMVGVLISIFLLTALFGRLWCGWACPQTVYMEFVYRPIERLFCGTTGKGGVPRREVTGWRKLAMYAVFFIISFYLAHTFLAYFVGVENLRQWIFGSPLEHPIPFTVVVLVTGLMMFDFCYFREQLCIIACPYGRLQSVLVDRQSLIISYDPKRGEPRGKLEKGVPIEQRTKGDCIDCHMCVTTCPTGIDIRKGLQMECIGCAQCIDACDSIMDRIGRSRGLIRYSSQQAIEGEKPKLLRPRVIFYPAILLIVVALFGVTLGFKSDADITLLRTRANPYMPYQQGLIANPMRLKIVNRTDAAATYSVEPVTDADVRIISEALPMRVEPGATRTEGVLLVVNPEALVDGQLDIELRVTDEGDFEQHVHARLLGPVGGVGDRGKVTANERSTCN